MTDLNGLFYTEYYGDIHAINEDINCAIYDEELLKNKTHKREDSDGVWERKAEREKLQNSVLIWLESSRMIFDIFTLC